MQAPMNHYVCNYSSVASALSVLLQCTHVQFVRSTTKWKIQKFVVFKQMSGNTEYCVGIETTVILFQYCHYCVNVLIYNSRAVLLNGRYRSASLHENNSRV